MSMHHLVPNLLQKINEYDQIGVFAHKTPDPDALGSEYGMYFWLKTTFPIKILKFWWRPSIL